MHALLNFNQNEKLITDDHKIEQLIALENIQAPKQVK